MTAQLASSDLSHATVAIIGAGPAGLMAADVLAAAGHSVAVYDAMPSVGRKFLLAGIGGLNLTHSEDFSAFITRYGLRQTPLAPLLAAFGAAQLRAWARELGVETFVGSSGRVFPEEMKAAPLLRAWLQQLRERGVRFHVRHRWQGWEDAPGALQTGDAAGTASRPLRFDTPEGKRLVTADVTVLALGGASWARLGSDGAWVPLLTAQGITVAPFRPANCGFEVERAHLAGTNGWSPFFGERFAGQPLKSIAVRFTDHLGHTCQRAGECLVTRHGLEGSLIYALSAALRDTIEAQGHATLHLDLVPGRDAEPLATALARPRGSRSLSSHLQSKAGITGVKAALLREYASPADLAHPARLADLLKHLPLRLTATRPLDEAISSAGGIVFEDLDDALMLRGLPGVFCCGEMLDWEAPTGGYLLTGCFTTGKAAGHGADAWLRRPRTDSDSDSDRQA